VLYAVGTHDCDTFRAIASGALSVVDQLLAKAVHLMDDSPNDAAVSAVRSGVSFPPFGLRLCHLKVKPDNDAILSRRADRIQPRNTSSFMLVPTAKNFTVGTVSADARAATRMSGGCRSSHRSVTYPERQVGVGNLRRRSERGTSRAFSRRVPGEQDGDFCEDLRVGHGERNILSGAAPLLLAE
jgi:hypothetical protein